MSQFWDERFAEPGFKYGLQANASLRQQARAWPAQLGHTSGGPRDADMLVTLAALREDFAGLLSEQLGEGPGHLGPARVTRYVGVRP